MFDDIHAHGAEAVHIFHDAAAGLNAIVAVHSTRLGPAFGGCRFLPYQHGADALRDALRLAEGMSYKNALAGIPFGGGKTVIMRPPGDFDRGALFEAFGAQLAHLDGRYITAMDSGTETTDMDAIARRTRFVSGQTGREGDPSPFTADGVTLGIEAAVRYQLDRDGVDGLTVTVQGLGHVGMALCERLHARGARLVVSDIDQGKVVRAVERFGAKTVSPEAVYTTDCDVFAPCSLGGVLNEISVRQLRCAVVAGAANNQLAQPTVADALQARGILYAPDYVINAGGVIHAALSHAGEPDAVISAKVAQIPATLSVVFGRAGTEGDTTAAVANAMGRELLSA